MLKIFKSVSIAILLGLAVQQGQAAESDIVDGFTEFLVERANANLVAVFERRLKDDDNFKCYFPNTHAKIEKLRLADLFASRTYWQDSLQKDTELLEKRVIFVTAQSSLRILERSRYIEAMQSLSYEYEGESYPVTSLGINSSPELRRQINGFWFGIADALDKIESQPRFKNTCESIPSNEEDVERLLDFYQQIGDDLKEWAEHVDKYGKNLRLSNDRQRELYCQLSGLDADDCSSRDLGDPRFIMLALSNNQPAALMDARQIAERLQLALGALDKLQLLNNTEQRSIERVMQQLPLLVETDSFEIDIQEMRDRLEAAMKKTREESRQALVEVLADIKRHVEIDDADYQRISGKLQSIIDAEQSHTERALVALELLEDSEQFSDAGMERLRRSVMFFVSIADAEDKDAVKAILEAYTLPAVSYSEKRKQGDGFFISSYLGLGLADTDVHGSQQQASDGGLFVPVGLEYNYGRSDGASVSVMLSPIDMAYPVNLKLRGIEEDVEFDELIAPSLTVSYGFEDWPVNLGIGYQRGRRLADVDKTEEKWLLFLTFDMPLLRLY